MDFSIGTVNLAISYYSMQSTSALSTHDNDRKSINPATCYFNTTNYLMHKKCFSKGLPLQTVDASYTGILLYDQSIGDKV